MVHPLASTRLLAVLALTLAVAVTARAQAPTYTTSPGTTLDYREVAEVGITMNTPMGSFPVDTRHEATVHLEFFADDSLRAVYRSLDMRMTGPDGSSTPDTGPVLDQFFVVHVTPDGDVTTVSTPDFPQDIASITNLAHQFWDFFVPLPDEPLADGLVWTDSTGFDEQGVRMVKFGRFEVVGDTTIEGMSAKIVRSAVDHRIEMQLPAPEPGVSIVSALSGTETGRFFFSVERGLLVGRARRAEMGGVTRIVGGPQPFEFNQSMNYSNTLEWVSD